MRVGVDANLSYRTVNALNAVYADSENQNAPVFECVGAGEAESDAPWLSEFAKRGGNAILGVDKRILSRPHEVKALQEAGLSACFLDFGANGAKLNFQTGSLVNLWPRISAIWMPSSGPVILRAKVLSSLSSHSIEELDVTIDGDIPKVSHRKFHAEE